MEIVSHCLDETLSMLIVPHGWNKRLLIKIVSHNWMIDYLWK